MMHSKLKALEKYTLSTLSKKMKDFTGYGGLHMLYKPMNRPSKYIFLL